MKNILVTGGCGYVGSRLVPYLLSKGYNVRVIDSLIFGNNLKKFNFDLIEGDINDSEKMTTALKGMDAVIHLAAISNDPTAELEPEVTKKTNYDAVIQLVELAKKEGIKRVILASSSTLYGFQGDSLVKEDDEKVPLTLYGKYKAEAEDATFKLASEEFIVTAARPGTVAGFSLRQRFDLIVNIFSNHALSKGEITIEGGDQKRPIIHIQDMCRAYETLLTAPAKKVNKEAFNIVGQNKTVGEIGKEVATRIKGTKVNKIDKVDDRRSYFTSSDKIKKTLEFEAKFTVNDAIDELRFKFEEGFFTDSLTNKKYYNIKTLKEK